MTENREQKRVLFIISAGLVAATLIAYEPIRQNDFVRYDDHIYITENHHVTGGITRQSITWAFTKWYEANWHPLTWLSHMLDCEIYGLNPVGHHITNVLLHVANSLLLFLLLLKMTDATWKSAFVAAVFALHPLHVESVAWAAERKDVLSGLFWMLTILAYIHYANRPGIKRYSLVLLAFAMGLMSKPMVVTLPFVLLLLDWWPLNRLSIAGSQLPNEKLKTKIDKRKFFSLLYEKIPLFAMSAVSCVITLVAQKQGGAVASLKAWPLQTRIINSLGGYFNYVVKMFYPKGLAVSYPTPENVKINVAVLTVIGVVVLLVLGVRGRRWLVVGLLWYLGTLVPVIGLVKVGTQMMADRYTYLPSIGIFIVIAWGVEEIFSKARCPRAIPASAAAAALIFMAFMTRIQVGYWQNSATLFERSLAVTGDNYSVLGDYGTYLCTQGRYEEGLRYLKKAARMKPDFMPLRNDICFALLEQKKIDEAISCFNEALKEANEWSKMYVIYNNLGLAYEQKANLALAETNYRKALALNPDYEAAQSSIERVFVKLDKLNKIITSSYELIKRGQGSAEVYYRLAAAFSVQGKYDEAINSLNKTLELNPDHADARKRIGILLAEQGRLDEALPYFNEVLKTEPGPGKVKIYENLGEAYKQKGRYREAIQLWTSAVELEPGNVPVLNKLAWLMATAGDASIQDANKATEFARRACEITGDKNPSLLDTLAAAYAAGGKFDDAITTADKALVKAMESDQIELANEIQERIILYKSGQRYQQKTEDR